MVVVILGGSLLQTGTKGSFDRVWLLSLCLCLFVIVIDARVQMWGPNDNGCGVGV